MKTNRSAASRKAVIAGGDPVHDVVGDMVEEDRPVRDAAKQVEPEVAALFGERGVDFHGRRCDGCCSERRCRRDGRRAGSRRGGGYELSRRSIMTIPVGKAHPGGGITDQFPKGVSILCPRFPPTATVTHRNRHYTRGPTIHDRTHFQARQERDAIGPAKTKEWQLDYEPEQPRRSSR